MASFCCRGVAARGYGSWYLAAKIFQWRIPGHRRLHFWNCWFWYSLFHRNDKSLLHPVDIFIKIESIELSSQLQRHHEDLTTASYLIFETELSLFFIQITPFLFYTRRITAIALLIHFRALESMVLWHCYQHNSHLLGHKDCLFLPRLCLHLFLSLINPTNLYEN